MDMRVLRGFGTISITTTSSISIDNKQDKVKDKPRLTFERHTDKNITAFFVVHAGIKIKQN